MKKTTTFKTLLLGMMLLGANYAEADVNTDASGRKQYVWNLGCEAKSDAGTYYLKATEDTYADYSTTYGTSGNYDIAMVVITGGSGRQIYANTSADSDKGGGAGMGYGTGSLEFYAPVSGVVTLTGCYKTRAKIDNKTTGSTATADSYLTVSAGDRIQIYSSLNQATKDGYGVEKIVLTQTYYGETITNPSHALSESSLTITPGVASWTAGGVAREANAGSSTYSYSTSQTINPTVTTYYTTDGSTPTTSSSVYSDAIDVSAISVVKYYSVSASGLASDVKAWSTTMLPVSTATTWDFSTISETLGGYICDGTLYVGSSITDDRASNKRVKFATALDAVPTEVGANIISFKTGVAGQVIMKLADYGSSSISVSDGSSAVATFAGTGDNGGDQSAASYHGGGKYFKYATFQAAANTQYYIYATAVYNAGVYSINFQPTGNNTTTALTEETTWDFGTQNDILTEFHGVTKDNMYFGEGTTNVLDSKYRIQFSGNGNTSTGANLISFKVPANVCGTVTVKPSCATDNIVLSDGTSTLKTFTSTDDNTEVAVPVTTTSETTLYLYTPSYTTAGTGIYKVVWTPVTEVSATMGTYGYTTFASSWPLDLSSLPSGLTAYYVTSSGITNSKVTLTEANTAVAAGTGLMLKGTANAEYSIPVASSGTDLSSTNKLVGCTSSTDITSSTTNYANFYVLVNTASQAELQNIKDYVDKSNTVTIPAGKAYLDATGVSTARLSIVFDDETTGISAGLTNKEAMSKEVYNLQGQRVNKPAKGLYIVNGKKVIIK